MSPLRIAHVVADYPPHESGHGRLCRSIATEQVARGNRVEVFTSTASGEATPDDGVRVHRHEPVLSVGSAPLIPKLARVPRDRDPGRFDVIHLHHPFIFGSELTRLGRRRRSATALVVTVHNRLVAGGLRRPLFAGYERTASPLLMRSADRICVSSEAHARGVPYLRPVRRRTPERIVELPNGADGVRFAPSDGRGPWPERLGIPDEAVVAISVGALDRAHPQKRIDVAIEAVARSGVPGLHLVVVGGGDRLDHFRALAAASSVAERIHFTGSIPNPELPEVHHAADLMLMISEPPESYPLAVTEGMASGLPVVITDFPGGRATVGDSGARVVPMRDPEAAAGALRELVELGPAGRAELGRRSRARFESELSWGSICDRLEQIYADAIAARRNDSGLSPVPAVAPARRTPSAEARAGIR